MAMPNKHEVVKVVGENEVERLTSQGWSLREVLQETGVESFNEQVPMLTPGNTYPSTFSATRGFVVTKNRYVMVQDDSKVLAQMQAQLDEKEKIVSNARQMQVEAEKKAEEWRKQYAGSLDANGVYARENERFRTENQNLFKSNQKMERDIAKIRSAIGELKMKEILEA